MTTKIVHEVNNSLPVNGDCIIDMYLLSASTHYTIFLDHNCLSMKSEILTDTQPCGYIIDINPYSSHFNYCIIFFEVLSFLLHDQ